MAGIHVKDKWGALECTFAGPVKLTFDSESGKILDTQDEIDAAGLFEEKVVPCYFLKCECGTERRELKSQFRGKRVVRDCGCGISAKGKARMVTISVPEDLLAAMEELARVNEVGTSYMWATAARQGLKLMQERKG